jgi:hypothetical protein
MITPLSYRQDSLQFLLSIVKGGENGENRQYPEIDGSVRGSFLEKSSETRPCSTLAILWWFSGEKSDMFQSQA